MLGGILYVAIRSGLRRLTWLRGLAFGLLLLALVGSILVSPDNPDFVLVSPAGLAVAMFAALPVLFGLVVVPLSDRLEPRIVAFKRSGLLILLVGLALLPLVLAGGLGLVIVGMAAAVWGLGSGIGPQGRRAARIAWFVALGALAIWRGIVFVDGVTTIL